MFDGKSVPKELSEEEKAEAEAAKGGAKGKAPAKDAKKGKEEEPTPEELERLEKEKAEREERERLLQEEWDQLDEETKHIRHNEDIYKEPCVKMQNLEFIEQVEKLQAELNEVPEEENEKRIVLQDKIDDLTRLTNIGKVSTQKEGYELVELEEMVNSEKGCWLRFFKLPPKADEADAGGKKAPAKGKGAAADDMKPSIARGWLSFESLREPGTHSVEQRVYLETCAPLTKKTNEDGTEEDVEEEEYEKVFEEAKTYVHIKLTFNHAITPFKSEKKEPVPSDIVPVKQFITWPYSKDPCDDFGKQVTLAVESLAKEFFNMFKK